MKSTITPFVEIEMLKGDPVSEVHFSIHANRKVFHLQVPVTIAGREQEPATESYRQDLKEVLTALQESLQHPQGLRWPYPEKT
jgi:hypothetical protein